MPRNKGFTLVELTMVVLIIGILVTIAVPNYSKAVERAKGSVAFSNIKTIRKAMLTYFSEYRTFGATLAQLGDLVGTTFLPDDGNWTYELSTAASSFSITAERIQGVHSSKQIVLTSDDAVSGQYYIDVLQ
ncbi:MAG: prepilin-type N-terminal cleavage/methylation domain-containing protein [Candidatus Omnitrophica bacterium]|nr:prepilin-type N-terminal cleavage/methylation domain-containing protein [Candidatus Omnitrophota bacterium]